MPSVARASANTAATTFARMDRSNRPQVPQIQAPNPRATNPSSNETRAGLPPSPVSTKAIQTTAAIIGKPRTCRNVTIQAPALGNLRAKAGMAEIASRGAAIPRPSAVNTPMATAALCDSA